MSSRTAVGSKSYRSCNRRITTQTVSQTSSVNALYDRLLHSHCIRTYVSRLSSLSSRAAVLCVPRTPTHRLAYCIVISSVCLSVCPHQTSDSSLIVSTTKHLKLWSYYATVHIPACSLHYYIPYRILRSVNQHLGFPMNLAKDPLITLHLKLEQSRLEIKLPLLLKPSHVDSKLTYLVKTVSRVYCIVRLEIIGVSNS